MVKSRKARRNTQARVAATGQRPAAAYRELRAVNAPYEGYVVDLHHVVDDITTPGHQGDSWAYRVRTPEGVDLTWNDVNAPDAGAPELTSRQQISLFGGWPLTPELLRARFPGARIIEHSVMPEGCHGCHLVKCWTVHVGCTVPCERLEAARETEARWEAEEAFDRANAAYQAELAALWRRHEAEDADLERDVQKVRERVEAWRTAVDSGRWEDAGGTEAMWSEWDACNGRERDQRERHDQEYKELTGRQPELPAHWETAVSA
ncbi:hypothetical protein ACFV98_28255 [Streptomyces violascens]|uniref:hypothetical protein n=1 Tax=Streptomyces violascens TaxID=67381 RepID=UPI00364EBD79